MKFTIKQFCRVYSYFLLPDPFLEHPPTVFSEPHQHVTLTVNFQTTFFVLRRASRSRSHTKSEVISDIYID